MADRSFPGPYINSVPEKEDPIMKGVPKATMDIGARSSGLPKGTEAEGMGIKHVGDQNGKGR